MFDPSKIDIEDNNDDKKKNIKKEGKKDENKPLSSDILNEIKKENQIKTTPKKVVKKKIIKKAPAKKIITEKKSDIIYDINITNIDLLLNIITDNEYDFAICEPFETYVQITFSKDKIIKNTKYIKYHIYSNILIKAKALTKLKIDEIISVQEGEGEILIKQKSYKVITKVVSGDFGEKLFIKPKEIQKHLIKKQKSTTSTKTILGFLGIISFIALIIGGSFLGFVVMNAKTVEDVKFFASLGINLADINSFIGQAVSWIFSILVLIEIIFLIAFLFKFMLTKKDFKQTKIKYGIISALILFITFSTGTAWLVIDKNVKSLRDWQSESLGEVQLYDNGKLLSNHFKTKISALITDPSILIGPITIEFDLSVYSNNKARKGMKVQKYIWNFGDDEDLIETSSSKLIKDFNKKGINTVQLTTILVDPQGELKEEIVKGIKDINITHVVNIKQQKTDNGGNQLYFDASELKELGKIEWYFMEDLTTPVEEGNIFSPGKIFFDETLVGMYIRRSDKKSEELDKIFIIKESSSSNILGEINYKRSLSNDLEYDFWIDNIQNDFGDGFIEEFKWKIGSSEKTKKGNIEDLKKSSNLKFVFKSYGEHDIQVTLTNSKGQTKIINKTIDILKKLNLKKELKIFNNGKLLKDIIYENNVNEYFINEIAIPTILKLDARFVKPDNILYTLQKVTWDIDSDGDIDDTGKTFNYEINNEGNHNIKVNYEFEHRAKKNDKIKLSEQIFIEGVRKEAMIDFEIVQTSNYVPVNISFDASKSQVKDENIEKFVWDYGDGYTEVRDSVVYGHKYTKAGNYEINLTVYTTSGKKYTKTKKLILKPKPQSAKISTSMKKAPVGQGIDFSSNQSEGQIVGFFWDFGDGQTSTIGNPTHKYKKSGTYTVKLTLDFANKNIEHNEIEIVIE